MPMLIFSHLFSYCFSTPSDTSTLPQSYPRTSSASGTGGGLSTSNYSTFPPPASKPPPGKVEGCAFCDVSVEKGFKVVYEDQDYAVFRDRSPGSRIHLLAVPKRHIDNVKSLRRGDVGVVREMGRIGTTVMESLGIPKDMQRLGFHIPPFFSVNHLHLHILSLPLPLRGALKYRPSVPSPPTPGRTKEPVQVKGWSWFVEISQLLRILEGGERVRVGSVSVSPSAAEAD